MEEPPTSKTLGYYLLILGGHTISLFGSSVVYFIIFLHITVYSGDTRELLLFTIANLLPMAIAMLFVGVFSDILNRKKVLIIMNILRVLTTFILIFLYAFGTPEINILSLLFIIRSISQAFYQPTFFAIIPSMVIQKHLGRINGLTYFLTFLTQMFVPFWAASLITNFPMSQSLWIEVIAIGIALIPLLLIKIPQVREIRLKTEDHRGSSFIVHYFKHFIEGFRAIIFIPGIIILFGTIFIFEYISIAFSTLLAYYIIFFHAGTILQYAIISSVPFLGIIIGTIVCLIKKHWNPVILIFFLSMFLIFLGDLAFILAPYRSFFLIMITRFIEGLFLVLIYTMFPTFIQSNIPKNKLGRANAIYLSMTTFVTLFAPFHLNLILLFISDIRLILLLTTIVGIISLIALYMFTGIRKIKFVNYKVRDNIEDNKN